MEQDLESEILLLREEIHKRKKDTLANSHKTAGSYSIARLGIEFVSAVFAGIILGLLLDVAFPIKPWGILSCFFLGCITGFYNIYKEVILGQRHPYADVLEVSLSQSNSAEKKHKPKVKSS